MASDKPLTAKSSVGDWLKHPVGGDLIRGMLAEGGMDEKTLKPVRLFSLQRLVQLSQGQLKQEVVDELVLRANGGVAPTVEQEAEADTTTAASSRRSRRAASTVRRSSSRAPVPVSAARPPVGSRARVAASSPSTSRSSVSPSSPQSTRTW